VGPSPLGLSAHLSHAVPPPGHVPTCLQQSLVQPHPEGCKCGCHVRDTIPSHSPWGLSAALLQQQQEGHQRPPWDWSETSHCPTGVEKRGWVQEHPRYSGAWQGPSWAPVTP
jgi:hypothetical protein